MKKKLLNPSLNSKIGWTHWLQSWHILASHKTLSDVRLSGQQKTFYCHCSCNRNDPKSEGLLALLVSKNTDPCGIGDFCAHIQSNSIFPRIWMIPTSPCKCTILNHSAIGPTNGSRQYTPLDGASNRSTHRIRSNIYPQIIQVNVNIPCMEVNNHLRSLVQMTTNHYQSP